MATPSGDPAVFPPLQTETYGSQLFWLALAFAVLYWAMAKIIVPRLAAIVEGRSDRIAKDLELAGRARAAAEDAATVYEKAVLDARGNAQALATKARDELAAKSDERRKATEADLAKKLSKSEAQIARRKAEAMGNVRDIALETASVIVEQITGRPAVATKVEAVYDSLTRA